MLTDFIMANLGLHALFIFIYEDLKVYLDCDQNLDVQTLKIKLILLKNN